jgi:hypothetical protein
MFIYLRRDDTDINPGLRRYCLLNINLETKIMCLCFAAHRGLSSFDIDAHLASGHSLGRNFSGSQTEIEGSTEKCLAD